MYAQKDQLLGEIHAQGTTRNDILEGLKSIPFVSVS